MVACIVVGLLSVLLPPRPFAYASRGSTCASALRDIDGWAGSAGAAAETPAAVGAGHVLGIPSALASFQGPAASTQYKLVSLADTFSQELADAFHASGSFRTALIGCAPDLTVLFKAGTSLEQTADSTSEEDKEGSAAGSASPAPRGEDPPHPLRKKPRGRTPRGMRWDGTNEAGHWVNDNKGSKDDPIDLCD